MANGSGNKSGPVFAIVGIGCLVLAVAGVVVAAILIIKAKNFVEDFADDPAGTMVELAVKKDPNLEFIESDKKKGTITFRDKKSGKKTTISWDDWEKGKFSVESGDERATVNLGAGRATVETPEGTTTLEASGLEKFPKWFELPEGIGGWKTGLRQEKEGGQFNGSMVGESARPVAELKDDFVKVLVAAGFAEKQTATSPNYALLHYEDAARKRTVTVSLFKQAEQTGVSVGYEQK